MARRQQTESTAALQTGFRRTQWTVGDLWVASVGVGGEMGHRDVVQITGGLRPASQDEHDVLASALNDYFIDGHLSPPVKMWGQLAQPE